MRRRTIVEHAAELMRNEGLEVVCRGDEAVLCIAEGAGVPRR